MGFASFGARINRYFVERIPIDLLSPERHALPCRNWKTASSLQARLALKEVVRRLQAGCHESLHRPIDGGQPRNVGVMSEVVGDQRQAAAEGHDQSDEDRDAAGRAAENPA